MRTPVAERARPAARLPEPGRLWIRYAPRDWPGSQGFWVDLATAGLGRPPAAAGLDLPALGGSEPLDDLLYLPPVPPQLAAARDDLARRHLAAGTPVMVQVEARLQTAAGGEVPAAAGLAGAVAVLDPLAALLARDLAALDRIPPGAAAVWPLASGLTDAPELWEEGCARLAAAGATAVQALALDLGPADRRRLVERCGEAAFEPLFHRPSAAPAERAFARAAHRHGLAPFLPRPLPSAPAPDAAGAAGGFRRAGAANRRLAGQLALAAELWLRLGRPAGQGQALYAAARQADRTAYDLAALAREGNLAPLAWLDAAARRMVDEGAAEGTPALLAELLAEYVAPEG
jgi:hypothetical protein